MNNLLVEVNNRIATVTFNRPAAYNALNIETLKEIEETVDELNNRSDVAIIVFTGMGKAFIAGADIKEMAGMNEEEAANYSMSGARVFRKIELMNKITVAAINGYCLGGGNELSLSCDIRLSSPKAKFGQPEVTLGITPGFSATMRLKDVIGIAKAKELLFTGRTIDASEAQKIGLVSDIIGDENFLTGVYAYLQTLLHNSLYAVLSVKKILNEGKDKTAEEQIELETRKFASCFNFYDHKEGMQAFLEKRQAEFKKEGL